MMRYTDRSMTAAHESAEAVLIETSAGATGPKTKLTALKIVPVRFALEHPDGERVPVKFGVR